MKLFRLLVVFLLFGIIFQKVPQVSAFEVRSGESVTIDHSQTINSWILVAGTTVVVDGVVRGDVYCAGKQITISGLVDGDVLCAGQSITISGVVTGDARLTGQAVGISGVVRRNAAFAGQTATLTDEGSVNGEILFAGQSISVNGLVGKGISGVGQSAAINGRVNSDVWFVGQTLAVGEKAVVGGNVKYTSQSQIQVPRTASVAGTITFTQAEKKNNQGMPRLNFPKRHTPSVVGALLSIGWNLFIISLVILLFPKVTAHITRLMKEWVLPTGVIGFVGLVAVPIAGILLAITIIGIPFALVLFIAYAFFLAVSRIFPTLILGEYIVERFFPKKKDNRFLPVVLGVPVAWCMFNAPFVGGLVSFVALLWGFGGILRALLKIRKK